MLGVGKPARTNGLRKEVNDRYLRVEAIRALLAAAEPRDWLGGDLPVAMQATRVSCGFESKQRSFNPENRS